MRACVCLVLLSATAWADLAVRSESTQAPSQILQILEFSGITSSLDGKVVLTGGPLLETHGEPPPARGARYWLLDELGVWAVVEATGEKADLECYDCAFWQTRVLKPPRRPGRGHPAAIGPFADEPPQGRLLLPVHYRNRTRGKNGEGIIIVRIIPQGTCAQGVVVVDLDSDGRADLELRICRSCSANGLDARSFETWRRKGTAWRRVGRYSRSSDLPREVPTNYPRCADDMLWY